MTLFEMTNSGRSVARLMATVTVSFVLVVACHGHDHGYDHGGANEHGHAHDDHLPEGDPSAALPHAEPAGGVGADDGQADGALAVADGDLDAGRLSVPSRVRRSIGLTFAQAVRRPVAATIRVPGYFDLLPSGQHHYPLPATGRVTVHVTPLQRVKGGDLLLEVDAPAWRALQRDLGEAVASRSEAAAALAQARASRKAAATLSPREGEGRQGDGDVYGARVRSAKAAVAAARDRFDQHLAHAATLTGLTVAALRESVDGEARWRVLSGVPVRAVDDGVVRDIDAATGTWVAESTEIVHVVHTENVRFRGRALQADLLDRLRDGSPARVVPPPGRGRVGLEGSTAGRVRLGVTGDPTTRTVDVFVDVEDVRAWMRPQVAAIAEIVVAGSLAEESLAIPQRAVIKDGLETVYFRRDRTDPDVVVRTVADFGPADGDWVAVRSGLRVGDEVVVDGIYQLKLASSSLAAETLEAGHVHADGTSH